jgi:hypothetical protein
MPSSDSSGCTVRVARRRPYQRAKWGTSSRIRFPNHAERGSLESHARCWSPCWEPVKKPPPELQSLHELRAALAERARVSDVAADFHAELNRGLRGMLSNALASRLPEGELPLAVDTFVATVEGCVLQQLDREQRRRLLLYALGRILGDAAEPQGGP